MIRSTAVTFLVLALLPLPAHHGVAQVRGQGLQLSREEMLQVIQQRFQNRLARSLQLDEGQREELADIFGSFSEARAELQPRRRELRREIRQLLTGDRSEERAMELIQELRGIRQREADLLLEEEDRLLEILTPSQVLRFQTLRDQFGEQIRRLGSPNGPNFGPGRQGPGRPPGGPRR